MYFEIPGTSVRVLGSLHMIPASAGPLPTWVTDAYEWCEAIVHEHDNAQVLPCMQGDVPLRTILRPATRSALMAALPNQQLRAEIEALRPWAALIKPIGSMQSAQPGVEAHVLSRAAVDRKPLQALETAGDLRRAFDSAPLVAIEDALDRVLQDPQQLQQRFEALY